jgi:hypothetical protein
MSVLTKPGWMAVAIQVGFEAWMALFLVSKLAENDV